MTPHDTISPATGGATAQLTGPGRWDRWDAFAVCVILVIAAIPLRGLMRYQGPAMEEGFMLAFPEMVLHGLVPNRDFLHLYGPGGLWVLAGVYKVFGVSLGSERLVGLAQQLGIIFGMYALTRRWGRGTACVASLMVIFINMSTVGLTALAWNGAVAFGLWGLWNLLGAREKWVTSDVAQSRGKLLAAGLLMSMAVLYRPDLVLACALASTVVLWRVGWRRLKWFAAGLGLAVAGYLAQAAMAGPGHAFKGMVVEPIFTLRAGRSLPLPPSWNHLVGYLQKAAALRTVGWPFPQFALPHQLYLWFLLTVGSGIFVAGVGWWAARRDPSSSRSRGLFALGLFGLGLCTQALQRVDQAHLAWVSCVTMASLPAAMAELLVHRPLPRHRLANLRTPVAASAVAVVLLCGVIPQFTVRGYVDLSMQTFGHHTFGYPVNRKSRNFYLASPTVAGSAQELIHRFDGLGPKPGQRLFVGPVDLRRTPYSDAYFYYLYPELTPATYFVEMDPFDARPGTRLASDVASADWLILTNVWDAWKEPNESSKVGSDAPNDVVRRDFCRVGQWGTIDGTPMYELYRRCPSRDGS